MTRYFGPLLMLACLVGLSLHARDSFLAEVGQWDHPDGCTPLTVVVGTYRISQLSRVLRSVKYFHSDPCVRVRVYVPQEDFPKQLETLGQWHSLEVASLRDAGLDDDAVPTQQWAHLVEHALTSSPIVLYVRDSSYSMGRPSNLPMILKASNGYCAMRTTRSECALDIQGFQQGSAAAAAVLREAKRVASGVKDDLVGRLPGGATLSRGKLLLPNRTKDAAPAEWGVRCVSAVYFGWFVEENYLTPKSASYFGKEFLAFTNTTDPLLNASAARLHAMAAPRASGSPHATPLRRKPPRPPLLFATVLPAPAQGDLPLCRAVSVGGKMPKGCHPLQVLDSFVQGVARLGLGSRAAVAFGIRAGTPLQQEMWLGAVERLGRTAKGVTVVPVFLPNTPGGAPTAWAYSVVAKGFVHQAGTIAGVCFMHPLARGLPGKAWLALPLQLQGGAGASTIQDPLELSVCVGGGHLSLFEGLPPVTYAQAVRFLHQLYGLPHADVGLDTNTSAAHLDIMQYQDSKKGAPAVNYPFGSGAAFAVSPDQYGLRTSKRLQDMGSVVYSTLLQRARDKLEEHRAGLP